MERVTMGLLSAITVLTSFLHPHLRTAAGGGNASSSARGQQASLLSSDEDEGNL